MELLLDINKSKENLDKNNLEISQVNEQDLSLLPQKNEFEKVVNKVLDQASDYIIKSLPYGQNVKDILIDVKEAIKTKDAKQIISTAVSSSIREGLEILGTPFSVLKDIIKLKDIALKGGLKQSIIAGLDIIANKYLKGNLLGNFAKMFFDKLKNFIQSSEFIKKITSYVDKAVNKVVRFKDECKKWYLAYENFDIEMMNNLSSKINKDIKKVEIDSSCVKEGKIIENMTNLVNTKKEKLSKMQLQMCEEL